MTRPTNQNVVTDPSPRRGEVWLVAFDPSVGGEVQKTRPAVILSNNAAAAYVQLAGKRRTAMADQITTAGKRRLLRRIGSIATADRDTLGRVVRRHLDLG